MDCIGLFQLGSVKLKIHTNFQFHLPTKFIVLFRTCLATDLELKGCFVKSVTLLHTYFTYWYIFGSKLQQLVASILRDINKFNNEDLTVLILI